MESAFNLSLLEQSHISEMQENLNRKLRESQGKDFQRLSGMGAMVLTSVVAQNYERAADDLRLYIESRAEYPGFQARAERYVHHCGDLIQAIETKRTFPGLGALSLSKQQEIHEKVIEHFEELKVHLKQIEAVERDVRLTDIRSTAWVVKAASYTVMAVVGTAFMIDLWSGLLSSTITVTNDLLDQATTWLVSLF